LGLQSSVFDQYDAVINQRAAKVVQSPRKRSEEPAVPPKTTTKKSKAKGKTKTGVDQRLVKALAHPLRVEILTILNERMASPNELSKELDEGLSQVSYHVKVLKDYECIELVKTEPRRGAVEHYYRATARSFLDDSDWATLPASVKPGVSATSIKMLMENVVEALQGGTFDARDDRHISWTPGVVDRQGWDETVDLINETLAQAIEIQANSTSRLAKSGEEGIPTTVALMHYEEVGEASSKAARRAKNAKAAKKS
jgi:DNA-binding transcriptional ArsR family regulator